MSCAVELVVASTSGCALVVPRRDPDVPFHAVVVAFPVKAQPAAEIRSARVVLVTLLLALISRTSSDADPDGIPPSVRPPVDPLLIVTAVDDEVFPIVVADVPDTLIWVVPVTVVPPVKVARSDHVFCPATV